MRSILLLNAALAVLLGCARMAGPDMALACQTSKCTCLPESSGLLVKGDAAAVQWKLNGDAFCPEGYVLRRDEKKK
jgi:hypothetical protein